ncbi:MAG: endonuclease III [Planctomycetes bacterium]|nr:endonuclease III [Planctomycetota bacterium]
MPPSRKVRSKTARAAGAPRAPKPPAKRAADRLAQAGKVNAALKQSYPDAACSLDYAGPLQLLVATILSAQCTDARVNKVTPGLFARYPDAQAFAAADPKELEAAVQSTGFYRNKARAIREACGDIVAKHGGQVPSTLEALTALRGVGRKTANVVLGNAFGTPGVVVDTHVGRLSNRLGLTKNKDPVKVEHDLMKLLPPQDWVAFGHRMIAHGRAFCKAPTPRCTGCPLDPVCHYPKRVYEDGVNCHRSEK